MAISYSQKVAILDHLANNVAKQKSVVLLTTANAEESLDAVLTSQFRKKAFADGVSLQVIKNTLIKKTFQDVPDLEGPTYLAYLADGTDSDEIGVPKSVVPIINKDFKENFKIVGSIVNGEFIDAKATIILSKTPSLEESMAKVAGGINQLATKLAISVNEIPTKLSRAVSEYSKTIQN